MPVESVMLSYHCLSSTLCVASTPTVALTCDEMRTDTCGFTSTISERPPSARRYCTNRIGTTGGRLSPSISTHGLTYGSTRSAGPPRVQLRSQNVVPSCPPVIPVCSHQLFLSWTWTFVCAARSSTRPAAVQYCHKLKFQKAV